MARVLVTGASGYIGALTVDALAARRGGGVELVVATDVRPPPPERLPAAAVWRTLDVRSPAVADTIAEHGIDTVVHLASVVTPPPGMSRETQRAIDVEGTDNVVRACLAHGVRRLVVTSSGAAYGYHADNAALLTEDDPLRGNASFAYSDHKRIVEERLAEAREAHPELEQVVFRPCTVLGRTVRNQITAIFDRPVVLGLSDAATPFVFVWDEDVVECLLAAALGEGPPGVYNLAADGALTLREIAWLLHKPFVGLPSALLARALGPLQRAGLTGYGPEQVDFLRYRPVLSNERLKRQFGYVPRRTSREVFELYARHRG